MPDQDDGAAPLGVDHDDPVLAAERLERALERIAASAHRASASVARPTAVSLSDHGPTREVAARLDALIAQLRTSLDRG